MQTSGQEQDKAKNLILIKLELAKLEASRQEKFPIETINVWIELFREVKWSVPETIKRIRQANFKKRYGTATTFADFIDDNEQIVDMFEVKKLAHERLENCLLKMGLTYENYIDKYITQPITNQMIEENNQNYKEK